MDRPDPAALAEEVHALRTRVDALEKGMKKIVDGSDNALLSRMLRRTFIFAGVVLLIGCVAVFAYARVLWSVMDQIPK